MIIRFNRLKNRVLFGICLLLSNMGYSQTIQTLESCLTAADNHLPLAQQQPLIEAAHRAALAQLRSNYLPQASLNGQATWQSDVTSLPINLPNFEVPTISKDQYRVTLDVVQPIWDGGQTAQQGNIQTALTKVEQQRVLVDRYTAREQTMQLYCVALLSQKQLQALAESQKDIRGRREKMQEQVNNGTAIAANVLTFDARLLELEQMQDDANARLQSALDGLSLLTGLSISNKDILQLPSIKNTTTSPNERPELTLFGLQQASTVAQAAAVKTKLMPKFNAIATVGYARPGLNFLSNEFAPYAILGVNFKWNLSGFYNGTPDKERQQLRIQSDRVSIQREQFLLQNSIKNTQQQRDIERLAKVLERDKGIVNLREQIAATAAIQLENGVLTSSEYLMETTNATNAKINTVIHEIQLLQAQLTQSFINGSL